MKILADLQIRISAPLRRNGVITEKELKYFFFEYMNVIIFGKLYILPKIHKRLKNAPCRSVISNSHF